MALTNTKQTDQATAPVREVRVKAASAAGARAFWALGTFHVPRALSRVVGRGIDEKDCVL
jgi:hypothetical protein